MQAGDSLAFRSQYWHMLIVMGNGDNIFLIGPMGCGKTTVGRQLAKLANKIFFDSDEEIEKRTGVQIPLIFEIEGENGFRKRECTVIEELTAKTNIVLATGGGVILDEHNRRHLRERGWVVYLNADLDTLVKRTQYDNHRPLLKDNDHRAQLEKILLQRKAIYEQEADIVVESGQQNALQAAKKIFEQIKNKPTKKQP